MDDTQVVKPIIQDYKGSKTLLLNPGNRFLFAIGLTKARIIVSVFKYIQKFVESNGQSIE